MMQEKIPSVISGSLLSMGAPKFSQWLRDQKPLMITDTTLRDAHQSLFAARMRSYDMLELQILSHAVYLVSSAWRCGVGQLSIPVCVSLGNVHLSDYEFSGKKIPNILFQMLLRGSNAVGYANYPDNVVREFVVHSSQRHWNGCFSYFRFAQLPA